MNAMLECSASPGPVLFCHKPSLPPLGRFISLLGMLLLQSVRQGEAHYRAFQSHMVQLLKTLKANAPPAGLGLALL